MELKQAFLNGMNESMNMALATSVDGKPNVRVVTFGFDETCPNKLYFSTFQGKQKIQEFAQNPQVACMLLPSGHEAGDQVRIFGEVQKSGVTPQGFIALISKKDPKDAEMLTQCADMLLVYEVTFNEAWVTIGISEAKKYTVA